MLKHLEKKKANYNIVVNDFIIYIKILLIALDTNNLFQLAS